MKQQIAIANQQHTEKIEDRRVTQVRRTSKSTKGEELQRATEKGGDNMNWFLAGLATGLGACIIVEKSIELAR